MFGLEFKERPECNPLFDELPAKNERMLWDT
jgi:hypothetical protein